jgi:hypothetical protein
MRALFESCHAGSFCALRSDRGDRVGKRRRGGNKRRPLRLTNKTTLEDAFVSLAGRSTPEAMLSAK